MAHRSEPIRILRVIARLNVGGPALHVTHLTEGLRDYGYETTLVAGAVGEGEGSMEDFVRSRAIDPVFIPALQRDVSPAEDVFATGTLRRLIRETRPHILHTHTAKAGAVGRAAALVSREARPPVLVHTFHGHVLRGYFNAPTAAAFRHLERVLARQTDALVAVSPEVRDDLVALGVAPAARIAVVRLGLDLQGRVAAAADARATVRAQLGVPDDRFLIGWLGRMTHIKRPEDLLQAFAKTVDAGVDADLLLVGDGPLRQETVELAQALGVGDRCHFVGYRSEVGSLYAACDAIALSSANEGTPVTVIEALAAGRPVVSTDVGGVRDVVRDGIDGLLVPAGDIASFADRLQELAADPARAKAMGDAGRARVAGRYSIPRLLDDVDCLYRSLLEVKQPTHRRIVTPLSEPLTEALPADRKSSVPAPTRRLRVVIFSQYFPPEVGATQARMQTFAEHLSSRGHDVTVVSEFPNHPHGVIPERYRGHWVVDDRSNDYRVLRVWVRTRAVKDQLSRLELYLSYTALAALVAPLAGRADVVLTTSPPLFAGIAGLATARLNRAPFVLDVRDLWPDAAVSLGQISAGATAQWGRRLERWLYREAAAVTAVTRPFADHIDRLRGRGPRTVLIANGTLEQFFELDGTGADQRAALGGDGRLLVTFAGTHGIAQALPSVVEAADLARDVADFAFVGDGPIKSGLVAQAAEARLDNVRFLPQVPLSRIGPMLAASDALLVTLSAHPTFADFVPSKMIDFMAVGKPIVLSAQGEAARILELAGAGVVVPPEDPAALADALRRLAAAPDECTGMGLRGQTFARRRLRTIQAERMEQVLLDVTR